MLKKRMLETLMATTIVGTTVLSGITVQAAEEVTLNILKAEAQDTPGWEALAEKYHEEHPNVTIEIEAYDNDIWTVLKTRLNSGEYPDIFATFPYADTKVYEKYCLDLTDEPFISELDESTLDSVSLDGKILGACLYGNGIGMVYNKDIFEEAGITELPTTLDELETVCQTLSDKGYTPISNGYKDYWVFKDIIVHYLASEEGEPAEIADKISSGELSFSEMKYVPEVFDYIDLSLKYGADKPLETGYADQVNAIATGQVAMAPQGDWMETEVKAIDPEANLGFFPIPVGNYPELSKLMAGPAWAYHIAKDGEHVEEAKEFMNWLITSDTGKHFIAEDIGKLPMLKGDVEATTQLGKETQEYMANGQTYPLVQYYWPSGGFENALGESFQKYIAGTMTREECLEQFTADWQKLVATAE